MEKTRRVKIVTGLKCNIQCVFCYYRDNLKAPNRESDEILDDIRYAYRHGVREIDFSGGEPTIHPDLPALIRTAKTLGMERVCVITNGLRLSDVTYLTALKEAGLDEVLFSVHGPTAQIHDEITQCPGSFAKLTVALGHAFAAGLAIRINTVVNRINCLSLADLCAFILRFSPVQMNFITINDWCFAKNLVDRYMLPYSEMAPSLRAACDILAPVVPAVNVRYIPFCFMRGYERFVCDHRQVPFDRYEWVPRVRARLEEGTGLLRYLGIIGFGFIAAGGWKRLPSFSVAEILDECVVEGLRRWFYQKGPQCGKCLYRELCDGVERTYVKEFGTDGLLPVEGDVLNSPMYFRTGDGNR